jgi:integrase
MRLSKPFPYLYRDIDRKGAQRWRLRMPGRKAVTIKGAYGSAEFAANYRAAVEGEAIEPQIITGKHATFDALGRSYLRSADFAGLATETQRTRRAMVERLLGSFGKLPVARLEHRHVKAITDGLAKTPGVARNMLSTLRVLIALAITEGIRNTDPTVGIKRPKLSVDGWHSWTEEEIAQYEAKHLVGSQARLALALAIYTGQRAGDLVRMGKQHLRDGKIAVAQQKTGTRLWVPLHPELEAILYATPSPHLTFLISGAGKPYASAKSFGNAVNAWAKQAGLTGCPLHGLRRHALGVSPRQDARPSRSCPSPGTRPWPRSSATSGPPIRSAPPRRPSRRFQEPALTHASFRLTHGSKRRDTPTR